MQDNAIINIQDLKAVDAFLQMWDEKAQEKIWKGMGMNLELAQKLVNEIPENLHWSQVEKSYQRHQAVLYIKAHTLK